MKKFRRHRTKFISNTIIVIFLVLMLLLTLAFIFQENLALRFETLIQSLTNIEKAISELSRESHISVLLCIGALFLAKCYLPIPLTFICVISGMVYDTQIAFAINMLCMTVEMSIKFFEGTQFGGGMAEKVISLSSTKFLKKLIEFNGTGNPYVLFGSRLIPFISPNIVSRIYGSLKGDFFYYLSISVIGIIPRVYIYTRIGHTLFNPFSREFIVLMMIVVTFLCVSGFACNIYYGLKVNGYEQMLMFIGEKPKYKIVLGE